ncbi:uncharacterized protein LOC120189773 [Hibiscus syriacus]|uniref:uncharacterized protein LOC120189773 n=1 Tax=Hibiscus syriacus TaxID=106335 RepID=UPI001920B1DC|nr:uncharacterized protein LOC120189773 [Hibiscus syriacus]
MDVLKAMKAELEKMQEEKNCMEAWLIAAESALKETKRMLWEYKAMKTLADHSLRVFIEESGDNVENNGEDLDEDAMKELVEEAMRDFTEALNGAQSREIRPADGRNDGGYDGGSGGDHSKENGGTDGGGHSE